MNTINFSVKHAVMIIALSFLQILRAQQSPEGLKNLKGYGQTVYYSPNSESRAVEIATFMDSAGTFFQKEFHFTPNVQFFVLEPQHWKQYAVAPVYGFPHNIDHVRLAIGANDNAFWQSFLPPIDQLPKEVLKKINQAYQKNDGTYSMQPFFDLLALHEMAHSYHSQAGLQMQRHWMTELFANLMLHTYVAEVQAELLPALETFPEMVIGAGSDKFPFTNLADFEAKYSTLHKGSMTPENYGWYQSMLHHAAGKIYNTGGKEVLVKLWTVLKKYQEIMTDAEFVAILQKEVHPAVADVYLNWNH